MVKIEQSIHSNDCKLIYFSRKGKTKEDYEKELGVAPILKALSNMGWQRSQWHIYTREDLKKYKHNTIFIEIFSDYYRGYLRADSRRSLKDACNKALNQAMRFNKCEIKDGHVFENMPNYDNGMCHCKKCGFWGYTSKFQQLTREIEHYKLYAHHYQEDMAKHTNILKKYGLSFNMFNGLLIKEKLDGKKYNKINSEPMNEKCLKDIRKVLTKHGYLE